MMKKREKGRKNYVMRIFQRNGKKGRGGEHPAMKKRTSQNPGENQPARRKIPFQRGGGRREQQQSR